MNAGSSAIRGGRVRLSVFLNRIVLAVFGLQLVGYAGLVAVLTHSDASLIVETMRSLPAPVAVAIGLLAAPAMLLTILIGFFLEVVGISPYGLGTGIFSDSDVPFLIVAYALSVAVGFWLRPNRNSTDSSLP